MMPDQGFEPRLMGERQALSSLPDPGSPEAYNVHFLWSMHQKESESCAKGTSH